MSPSAPHRQRLSYGVGSIGTGVFTTVPSVLLLYFLTTEVHIAAAIAGVIILIPKAAGLIGDPLIGSWADRLRRRSTAGRQILMGVGALLGGLGLWALFSLPQRMAGNILVPAFIYFICTTGYSFFAVPYSALPAELDPRPEGRRALVSTRLGLAFLGVLIGGVSAPIVAQRFGYPVMGVVMGVVCAGAMGAFLATCRLKPREPLAGSERVSGSDATLSSIATRPFLIQMASFVMLLAAAGAFSSLLPFLVHEMGAGGDAVGLAMLVNIVVALVTSLAWPVLIRWMGLRSAWQLAAAITGLSAVLVGGASGLDARLFIGMAIGGAGLSGVQITGFTGLADHTAEHLKGGRGPGLITGLWMAGEKIGLASGPLLAGLGLNFLGHTPLGSAVHSSIALIPTVLAVLAVALIAFDPTGGRSGFSN